MVTKFKFSEAENIVLNMSAGLLPEFLTKKEVKVLEEAYGNNWFQELGYFEPHFKKPTFEYEK